jgi:hypothetical protein
VATVSPGLASKPVVGFLVEPQNQGGGGFPDLGLKTDRYGLMIWPQNHRGGLVVWASKSPQRFLGLGLKIMQALVCRLCHKTDGGRSAWDTRRDLVACFMWKQVVLGFSSLASRLAEARQRVVHVVPSWRLCRRQVEDRCIDVTGCVKPYYPCFTVFLVLGPRGVLVFCLGL